MRRSILLIIICLSSIYLSVSQTLTGSEIIATFERGVELSNAKRYDEALDAFLTVSKCTQMQRSEVERQIYVLSQTRASLCLYLTQRYEEGYLLAKSIIAGYITENEKRSVYRQYVHNGYEYAKRLSDEKVFDKARDILHSIVSYADTQSKTVVLHRIKFLWYIEAAHHFEKERFDDALACFENAIVKSKELNDVKFQINSLSNIAFIYKHLGHNNTAIIYHEKALLLSQQIGDIKLQLENATSLQLINNDIGNIEIANKYADIVDDLVANTKNKSELSTYFYEKGKELYNKYRYQLAELNFLKCKELTNKQDPNIGLIYSALRDVKIKTNKYDEALYYAQAALESVNRLNFATKKNYFLEYHYIAHIHSKLGDREACFKSLDSLLMAEQFIEEPREKSRLYRMRADCYRTLKEYKLALSDYRKAYDILSQHYSTTDRDIMHLYPMIGSVEYNLNHYASAERYYSLYANAIKGAHGEQSLDYIKAQIYLANAQGYAGHLSKGCENYTSAISGLKRYVKQRMPYMSASEREAFWLSTSPYFFQMTPYALKAEHYQTEYTTTCYNALLMSKAFLLDSERSLYDIIQKKGSVTDKQNYLDIVAINSNINEWEKDYSKYADSILMASNRVNRLEKSLIDSSKAYGDFASFMNIDYNDVKESLGENSVLIDFTDFVSQTQGRKYAAYIINPRQKHPLLKELFTESQIKALNIARPDLFYDEYYAPEILKLLWNPIRTYIPKGATIYYVPSQILFQVSLESIPLEDGSLLGSHYNFIRLSSARELVKLQRAQKIEHNNPSAVLYGGLKYDLDPEIMKDKSEQYNVSDLAVRHNQSTAKGDAPFLELPESKKEIEKISEILNKANFKVTSYAGKEGTEESFISLHGKSPQILHLATHGFYYTPTEASSVSYLKGYNDAMSLSGIIMSGANAAWQGKQLPEGVLGGVLTASNISHLDLSGTDMVVLSTCQSGQGEATPEGLYGLQRAFKKAGVGTIVMSLWNIRDTKTKIFMELFYQSFAENNWNKRPSFEQAKLKMRAKHPDPYDWAAFVMLD